MHKETKIVVEDSKEDLVKTMDELINDHSSKWKIKGGLAIARCNMGFKYSVLLTRAIKN